MPPSLEWDVRVARQLKALEREGLLTKRREAFVITDVPSLLQRLHGD